MSLHETLLTHAYPGMREELRKLADPRHALVFVVGTLDRCGLHVLPRAKAARLLMGEWDLFHDWATMPSDTIMIVVWPSGKAPVVGTLGLRRVPRSDRPNTSIVGRS